MFTLLNEATETDILFGCPIHLLLFLLDGKVLKIHLFIFGHSLDLSGSKKLISTVDPHSS